MNLEGAALDLVIHSRLAHLATADRNGTPHVVPICYAYANKCFYFVIDRKPKSNPLRLQRLRNICENPRVALLIDRYDDDWSQLAFVLVHGTAKLVTELTEWSTAVDQLRQKYPLYRTMPLVFEENPVVRITGQRYHFWSAAPRG